MSSYYVQNMGTTARQPPSGQRLPPIGHVLPGLLPLRQVEYGYSTPDAALQSPTEYNEALSVVTAAAAVDHTLSRPGSSEGCSPPNADWGYTASPTTSTSSTGFRRASVATSVSSGSSGCSSFSGRASGGGIQKPNTAKGRKRGRRLFGVSTQKDKMDMESDALLGVFTKFKAECRSESDVTRGFGYLNLRDSLESGDEGQESAQGKERHRVSTQHCRDMESRDTRTSERIIVAHFGWRGPSVQSRSNAKTSGLVFNKGHIHNSAVRFLGLFSHVIAPVLFEKEKMQQLWKLVPLLELDDTTAETEEEKVRALQEAGVEIGLGRNQPELMQLLREELLKLMRPEFRELFRGQWEAMACECV